MLLTELIFRVCVVIENLAFEPNSPLCDWENRVCDYIYTLIARFKWPTWGPPGFCRPQVDPMNLAIRLTATCSFNLTGSTFQNGYRRPE